MTKRRFECKDCVLFYLNGISFDRNDKFVKIVPASECKQFLIE